MPAKNKTMKKKILIISNAVNVIAGVFVLMAFNLKTKDANDRSSSFITLSIINSTTVAPFISITEGNYIRDDIKLKAYTTYDKIKENNVTMTRTFNELSAEGYVLVSSIHQDDQFNYIFEKK